MAMSSITVAGTTPDLLILGDYQRFIFPDSDPVIKLQAYGQFVPVSLTDSVINIETRNNLLSGFRWQHTSTTTDDNDFGTFKLQSFVSDGAGTDIISFDGTNLNFNYTTYAQSPAGLLFWYASGTNTPIASGGTYVKALGTTSLATDSICATMPANNRLAFVPGSSATQTITALVRASVTIQFAGAGTPLLSIAIYKNGSSLLPQAYLTGTGAANYLILDVECLTTLTNNDYLEVWVTSFAADATGITVGHGSLSFVSV